MIKKKVFFLFLLYIYSFIYIYNPISIYGVGLIYVIYCISIVSYFISYKDFNKLFLNKNIFLFFCAIIIIILYLLILYLLGGDGALTRAYSFILVILSFISATGITLFFKKHISNKMEDLIKFFIGLSLFQLFFVFLSITVPEFRYWALSFTPEDNFILSNDLGSGLRSYGFASGYTSSFPVMMGLVSLFCIFLSLKTKKMLNRVFYILMFIFLIFSISINARIGLIPPLLSFLCLPLVLIRKLDIKILVVLMLVVYLIYLFLLDSILNLPYMGRLIQGFNEIEQLLINRESIGTFLVLQDMWILPQDRIGLYFGEGERTLGGNQYQSDIGLVQDIFMYGIVFTILLFSGLLMLSTPLLLFFKRYFGLVFLLIFLFSIFCFYIKGIVFASNELFRMLFILVIFSYTIKYKKNYSSRDEVL